MNRLLQIALAAFGILLSVYPVDSMAQSEKLENLETDLNAAISFLTRFEEESLEEELMEKNAMALLVFPELSTTGLLFWKGVSGRGFIFLSELGRSIEEARSESQKKWRLASYKKYVHRGIGIAVGYLDSHCLKVIRWPDEEAENIEHYKHIGKHPGNIYLTDEIGAALLWGVSIPLNGANEEISCGDHGLFLGLGTATEPRFENLHNFDENGVEGIPEIEQKLVCKLSSTLDKLLSGDKILLQKNCGGVK